MSRIQLVTHVCGVCSAAYRAHPAATVTCVHGGRPERLRPAAIATIRTEPAPKETP